MLRTRPERASSVCSEVHGAVKWLQCSKPCCPDVWKALGANAMRTANADRGVLAFYRRRLTSAWQRIPIPIECRERWP